MRLKSLLSVAGILLAASVVLGGQSAPHALEKAKAGQWVFHKTTAPSADKVSTTYRFQWVDKVEGHKITLKSQLTLADGKVGVEPAYAEIIDLDKKPPDSTSDGVSTPSVEEIAVGNRKIKCSRVETIITDGDVGKLTTTRWISDDVPIYGTVRSVTVNKDKIELARSELVDFGQTGGSERPLAGDHMQPKRD